MVPFSLFLVWRGDESRALVLSVPFILVLEKPCLAIQQGMAVRPVFPALFTFGAFLPFSHGCNPVRPELSGWLKIQSYWPSGPLRKHL